MKKYINISYIYALSALASGVFYREFTKFFDFSGKTTLAYTHFHLFALGTLVFLLIALFSCVTDLPTQKSFKRFMLLYTIGLPFMVVMLFVRGLVQVLETELSAGANAAISGLSGIAHILVTIALVFLFSALKKSLPLNAN